MGCGPSPVPMHLIYTACLFFFVSLFSVSGVTTDRLLASKSSQSVTFTRHMQVKGEMHNDYLIASIFLPEDLPKMVSRVRKAGKGVDWILTCINEGCEQLVCEECSDLSKELGNSIDILRPTFPARNPGGILEPLRKDFIPKELVWVHLRTDYSDVLARKKAIWLIDTDIWFDDHFIDDYMSLYQQFPVPPLITQPTIRQNTQDYAKKTNQEYYDLTGLKTAY